MGNHDSHEVMQRLDALLPALRERAQETEDLRRIPDESIKALQETGFFRLLQPKQWGGYEADPVLFYSAVKKIASACGSTGWVSSIIGVHNWHLASSLSRHRKTCGATTLTCASRPLTLRWVWVK